MSFALLPVLVGAAAAAAPAELLVAQRVVLDVPERASMLPERPDWREGWVLAVRVGAEHAVLGQGPQADLWIGDQPVSRLASDPTGCLVVLVEGPVDLATAPVFFGAPGLAERLTPAAAAEQLRTAVAAGAVPFPTASLATRTQPEARLPNGGALPALAKARTAACAAP